MTILRRTRSVLDLKKDIIEPVLEEFFSEIKDRHIQIENRIGAISSRIFVKGSKIWLKAIFRNLLRNAIKYGDMGGKVGFRSLKSTVPLFASMYITAENPSLRRTETNFSLSLHVLE